MKKLPPFPGTVSYEWIERPFVTKTGKKSVRRAKSFVMNDEQREWLRQWFPTVENSKLMAATGLRFSTFHRIVNHLGLVKSEDGMKGIRKRQLKRLVATCKRNGYYDSLRGRPLHVNCYAASVKMWQEVHEGKRDHPLVVIRKKNPKRYKKILEKRSETRKELFRKERLRSFYGLPRHTKLQLVLNKFTRSQANHRYNALKRGYIIYSDFSDEGGERYNIYYDEATERAARFERNLKKDGFKVLPFTNS